MLGLEHTHIICSLSKIKKKMIWEKLQGLNTQRTAHGVSQHADAQPPLRCGKHQQTPQITRNTNSTHHHKHPFGAEDQILSARHTCSILGQWFCLSLLPKAVICVQAPKGFSLCRASQGALSHPISPPRGEESVYLPQGHVLRVTEVLLPQHLGKNKR